jgi:hypothetical protein
MIDYAQFFNPSAWGAWSPQAAQGFVRRPPPMMPAATGAPQPSVVNPQLAQTAAQGALPPTVPQMLPQSGGAPGMLNRYGF